MLCLSKCKKCSTCKRWLCVEFYKKNNKTLKTCIHCRTKRQKYKKINRIPYHIQAEHVLKRNLINNIILKKKYNLKKMVNNDLIKFVKFWGKKRNNKKNRYIFFSQLEQKTDQKDKTGVSIFKGLLINEIKKINKNEIKELCDNNNVINIFYKYVKNKELKLSTLKTYCSDINKIISERLNEPDFKKLRDQGLQINIRVDDTIKLNKKQKKQTLEKNEDVILINANKINNLIKFLKDSNVFTDKVILNGLSTGCRFIEILDKNTSTFTESKEENKIVQIGVAKQKKEKKEGYIKPVIFLKPSDVIDLTIFIRNQLTDDDLKKNKKQLTAKYSRRINKRLKDLLLKFNFSIKIRDQHFHTLRKIYANYCFELYGKQTTMSYPSYIKSILAHESYGALLNYTSVRIIFTKETEKKKEVKENKENKEDKNKEDYLKQKYKNPKGRGGKAKERRLKLLKELIIILKEKNIAVNYKTLQSFGYGNRILSEVLKKNKI